MPGPSGVDDVTTRPPPAEAPPVERLDPVAVVSGDEEMPRMGGGTRRTTAIFVVFVVVAVAFLYFFLPQIAGLEDTWERIEDGDPRWMAVAFVFEVLSIGGYVVMFRAVCARGVPRIGWRASYEITMAGIAATRVLAAGGAGGVALTAWAMRRAGMGRRLVACRMVAFLVLMYGVYLLVLLVGGIGLRVGILPGPAPFGVTVLPAILGGVAIAILLALSLLPEDLERRFQRRASEPGRLARLFQRLAALPATTSSGVRTALSLLRSNDPSLAGTLAWWGFNVGVLWASFHAFGEAPPIAVIFMGYFVGMLGNLLPLPGGVGGVDGGMIGAFLAFGVDDGLAVVAVLTYRAFAFWLPTIPGVIAYFQLRHTVASWRAPAPPSAAAA